MPEEEVNSQPVKYFSLNTTRDYFNSLPKDALSRRYYQGKERYTGSMFQKLILRLNHQHYLDQLANFYPYQGQVVKHRQSYQESISQCLRKATISGLFSLGAMAAAIKLGVSVPLISQTGRLLKTSKNLRLCLYAFAIPNLLIIGAREERYLFQTEKLWANHAKRMEYKDLTIETRPLKHLFPQDMEKELVDRLFYLPFIDQSWKDNLPTARRANRRQKLVDMEQTLRRDMKDRLDTMFTMEQFEIIHKKIEKDIKKFEKSREALQIQGAIQEVSKKNQGNQQ